MHLKLREKNLRAVEEDNLNLSGPGPVQPAARYRLEPSYNPFVEGAPKLKKESRIVKILGNSVRAVFFVYIVLRII